MGLGIYNVKTGMLYDPGTGDVVDNGIQYKSGKTDIVESLVRILFTTPGERVGNPEFGCNLRALLFEPEFIFLDEVKREIEKSVSRYESRVYLYSLDLEKVDFTEYKVSLIFKNKINGSSISIEQNVLT